jgi:two-component system, OmpR family, sensor histidine kinase TctE
VQRATQLSQQLLSLARVEQLRSRGEPGSCALGAAAREAALELSPLISERSLEFALELAGGHEVTARAHPWLVGELMRNLLHNAIRHAPRGSALGVNVDVDGGQARLVVWDQGPGIAPALRERVFEPFTVTGVSGSPGGSGLGLAICRAIVGSSDGRITLDEHRADAGAPGLRVTVHLPLAAAA